MHFECKIFRLNYFIPIRPNKFNLQITPLSVALIQPQFAPNLYDLTAMLRADRVIFMDTDPWSRKGRTHRAKIRSKVGHEWINVPIKTVDKDLSIFEVRINHNELWFTPFWNGILHNYSNATWFDYFHDELLALFENSATTQKLIDFNMQIFTHLCRLLEIHIKVEWMSETEVFDIQAQPIIQEYASRNYIRQWPNNIGVELPGNLIVDPECSIIDLLLTNGPESFRVLDLLK